jgi:cell division protein ZipA
LWEIYRKNKNKNKADILNAVDDISDLPISPNDVFTEEDYSKAIADLSELSTHLQNNRFAREQDSAINTANKINENISTKVEENTIENIAEINQTNKIQEDLLVFYITAHENTEFNGLIIHKALSEVGMKYGYMDIFHYFGEKDNSLSHVTDAYVEPLFSLANMHEPGSFMFDEMKWESTRMENFRTKGVVAFMRDLNDDYSYKLFENHFLPNVQRIAELLGGEIRTSNHKLLNDVELALIRDKLRLYAMKDFLKNDPK